MSVWTRTTVGTFVLIGSITGCGGGDDDGAESSTTTAPSTVVATTEAPATTVAATTVPPVEGAVTLDEATNVIDAVLAAFNAKDVEAISAIVGDGTWMGIYGDEFDSTTVGPYLAPLLAPIDKTEVDGEPVQVAGGYSFPLLEYRGGGAGKYFIVVYTDAEGVLTIRESFSPSPPG